MSVIIHDRLYQQLLAALAEVPDAAGVRDALKTECENVATNLYFPRGEVEGRVRVMLGRRRPDFDERQLAERTEMIAEDVEGGEPGEHVSRALDREVKAAVTALADEPFPCGHAVGDGCSDFMCRNEGAPAAYPLRLPVAKGRQPLRLVHPASGEVVPAGTGCAECDGGIAFTANRFTTPCGAHVHYGCWVRHHKSCDRCRKEVGQLNGNPM